MGKKQFLKSVIFNRNSYIYIWLLVGSLKSSHKEALKKPLLCEDCSYLTSLTSNHIPDIDIAVSVVYDIFEKNLFSRMPVIVGLSFIITVR